jgi:transcriptional regulator with XRE-family HTH domain
MPPASSLTGPALRAWREGRGLSRPRLAALLGVSVEAVKLWERGYQLNPARAPAPPPRMAALACAAIEAGLEPIGARGEGQGEPS